MNKEWIDLRKWLEGKVRDRDLFLTGAFIGYIDTLKYMRQVEHSFYSSSLSEAGYGPNL